MNIAAKLRHPNLVQFIGASITVGGSITVYHTAARLFCFFFFFKY